MLKQHKQCFLPSFGEIFKVTHDGNSCSVGCKAEVSFDEDYNCKMTCRSITQFFFLGVLKL